MAPRMIRGNVHLRDADPPADLPLREVLLEAQAQDLAVPMAEGAEQAIERRARVRDVVAGLVVRERVTQRGLGVVLAARELERHGVVRVARAERVQQRALADVQALRELANRRRATDVGGQALSLRRRRHRELLEVARDAHRPRLSSR